MVPEELAQIIDLINSNEQNKLKLTYFLLGKTRGCSITCSDSHIAFNRVNGNIEILRVASAKSETIYQRTFSQEFCLHAFELTADITKFNSMEPKNIRIAVVFNEGYRDTVTQIINEQVSPLFSKLVHPKITFVPTDNPDPLTIFMAGNGSSIVSNEEKFDFIILFRDLTGARAADNNDKVNDFFMKNPKLKLLFYSGVEHIGPCSILAGFFSLINGIVDYNEPFGNMLIGLI